MNTIGRAESIYDTTRAICHHPPHQLAPADLYAVLGNLNSGYGHTAAEALTHIAKAAATSSQHFTLTDSDGGTDPDAAMQHAAELIQQASAKAADIGKLLSAAQNAIASIGHQTTAAT